MSLFKRNGTYLEKCPDKCEKCGHDLKISMDYDESGKGYDDGWWCENCQGWSSPKE